MPNTAPNLFFNGDGKVLTAIGSSDDYGQSVTLQADGKILLAGYNFNGNNTDFALVRFLPTVVWTLAFPATVS
jgi:hypothetical protein